MIKRVKFENKKLIIESSNGTFIKNFNLEIDEVCIHMNKILVILKLVRDDKENRNIFCLDEDGKILWQIKDPYDYNPYIKKSDSRFTGIIIKPDNKIIVNNLNSNIYEVDINTGNLTMAGWTK